MNNPTSTADRLAAALADRYRLERELGAGGMATVFLADDLRHSRKVALKVLRPELAAVIGAERFLTEIRTTANLQHPHILPLFDSGEADGFLFYVMPFVEGETLRDRITRDHQLPVPEAVRLATEVAGALDYAHRRGVIHRDIKPENILLHDGQALVADFGIALAMANTAGTRMTETGMSLGTPHYMSPEQAMGEREITARSDVYALGAITYEMLIGEPPFTGPTAQAIIARVMMEEPRTLTGQRKSIPPNIEAAVFTALEKLPADRYATAAQFAAALADKESTNHRLATSAAIPAQTSTSSRRIMPLLAAAVAVVALAGGVAIGKWLGQERGGLTDVMHATIVMGDSLYVRHVNNTRFAISPDGENIVFVGLDGPASGLFVRNLHGRENRFLSGTTGAYCPFISPDGKEVGFFTDVTGKTAIKVVPLSGGAVRTVVSDSANGYGADWADDGNIYFSHTSVRLARVSANGGTITLVSNKDTSGLAVEHDFPQVLPGSRHALVQLWRGSFGANQIGVVDLQTGVVTELAAGTYARYVVPGFLVISSADGQVLAARFDLKSARMTGPPVLIAGAVEVESGNGTGQFAVSRNGTFVFQPMKAQSQRFVWVERNGSISDVDSTLRGIFSSFALSPDGRQLAVTRAEVGDNQVWIKQLPSGSFTRLSFDVQSAARPVWSIDGTRVVFLGTRNNRHTSWGRRADGSGPVSAEVPGPYTLDEILFHPDGKHVLLRTEGTSAGSRKLLVMDRTVDSVPHVLIESPFDHYGIDISPDGRWIAYVSVEASTPEVYVRPFPDVNAARFAISVGGGSEPRWSRNGKELFFRSARGEMFAAPVTTAGKFSAGTPVRLFTFAQAAADGYFHMYDVDPSGKRFLMVHTAGSDERSLDIVFNWARELERLTANVK